MYFIKSGEIVFAKWTMRIRNAVLRRDQKCTLYGHSTDSNYEWYYSMNSNFADIEQIEGFLFCREANIHWNGKEVQISRL